MNLITKDFIKNYCRANNVHQIKCKSPYGTIDTWNINYMLDDGNQATINAFHVGSRMELFEYKFCDYKKKWVFINEDFE